MPGCLLRNPGPKTCLIIWSGLNIIQFTEYFPSLLNSLSFVSACRAGLQMPFNVLMLARLQFAITTVYHFFFVPLTLGLSILVALMETLYVRSGKDVYKRMAKFWGKIFVINFAMGVVTGIVQEFQFGMNWSEYSRFVGDIFGAPLAIEALLAFFLESTFLGVWIFGWDRLSKRMHAATIWLVAIGSQLLCPLSSSGHRYLVGPHRIWSVWRSENQNPLKLPDIRGLVEISSPVVDRHRSLSLPSQYLA